MQLHNLPPLKKRAQRVGRGGKRGTTAGRGTKGQKSRAGRRIRPAERDLIIRLPKRRGFANLPKSPKPTIFNLGDLASVLKSAHEGKSNVVLDQGLLKKTGLLPLKFRGSVKILGSGEIKFPVEVRGLKVSEGAREKIERAGGRVIAN